jgi:hypothetical protein
MGPTKNNRKASAELMIQIWTGYRPKEPKNGFFAVLVKMDQNGYFDPK